MAFDPYGAPTFGVADAKVASWNSANDYGTAVDVMSIQMINTQMRTSNAELTGDDTITASAARPIGATVQMRWGGVSLAVLEVVLGINAVSSVASPNQVKNLRVQGGERMPYFGVVSKSLAEEGVGELVTFIPKCKIMGDITLVQQEYGAFAIPEMTVNAVRDTAYGIINLIERQAQSALVIPPANITVNA